MNPRFWSGFHLYYALFFPYAWVHFDHSPTSHAMSIIVPQNTKSPHSPFSSAPTSTYSPISLHSMINSPVSARTPFHSVRSLNSAALGLAVHNSCRRGSQRIQRLFTCPRARLPI
ncbi:hypothetical protein EXIGLDRAFT_32295 [Exidia glandulosa HHB12029]|uniref:Uncharacterized protein n=1 Tax=Exidia glandulosa HHB12029 TaxID=1314781 RepID=A0A166MVE7_EXIGL|nr:hypothetical protein EXIGLDRAFT_32295 [Exidia glandulosa HHB12029]